MIAPDLLPSAEETDLAAAVRTLLADRGTAADLQAMADGDRSVVNVLWSGLGAEIGAAGLLVPEEYDGAGAGARAAAVVMQEVGRAVAPVPFLTSAVLATTVLTGEGATAAAAAVLPQLASGRRAAALVLPFSAGPWLPTPTFTADADGRVAGRARSVAGVIDADLLVVPVADREGATRCVLVEAASADVTPVVSLDMTRQLADVEIDAAPSETAIDAGPADPALRAALLTAAGLLASEQAGLAQWCLAATVDHLRNRRQFGRVVGGFQALKHRLADLYADVEQATAAAGAASALLAAAGPHDRDTEIAVRVAASFCGEVAVRSAEEALQLHGGIGMTWEHPVHLYLKRAKADQIALGAPGAQRAALAGLVDLPAPGGDPCR